MGLSPGIIRLHSPARGVVVKFWIPWSIDVAIADIAAYFFFVGLVDRSVSSSNMRLWIGLPAPLAVILGGGLWLKSAGRRGVGTALCLVLAVPGTLYGVFLLLAIFSGTRWN